MWYELWDTETGNRVGKFPTEEAALCAVLEDIRRYGQNDQAIMTLGLLRRDPKRQEDCLIAEGGELVERAISLDGTKGGAE